MVSGETHSVFPIRASLRGSWHVLVTRISLLLVLFPTPTHPPATSVPEPGEDRGSWVVLRLGGPEQDCSLQPPR